MKATCMIFDLREPEHHPHKSHELIWKAKTLDFYIKKHIQSYK
jgi:hypothetical protein